MVKKRIFVFGDSNTWGWDPNNTFVPPIRRIPKDKRWTGILENNLGEGYEVIAEGECGRSTGYLKPESNSAKACLIPALRNAAPIDVCILSLGINDFQTEFNASPQEVADSLRSLLELILEYWIYFINEPKIIMVCPPPLGKIENGPFYTMFKKDKERSQELSPLLKKICEELYVTFVDAGTIIHPSEKDGLHLDEDQHKRLGEAISDTVKELL